MRHCVRSALTERYTAVKPTSNATRRNDIAPRYIQPAPSVFFSHRPAKKAPTIETKNPAAKRIIGSKSTAPPCRQRELLHFETLRQVKCRFKGRFFYLLEGLLSPAAGPSSLPIYFSSSSPRYCARNCFFSFSSL